MVVYETDFANADTNVTLERFNGGNLLKDDNNVVLGRLKVKSNPFKLNLTSFLGS